MFAEVSDLETVSGQDLLQSRSKEATEALSSTDMLRSLANELSPPATVDGTMVKSGEWTLQWRLHCYCYCCCYDIAIAVFQSSANKLQSHGVTKNNKRYIRTKYVYLDG